MKQENNTLAEIENLLLAQKRTLNVKELCRFTGLSESFIYKLTAAKRIPFSRPNGKIIFFDREKIQSFLLSNPIDPTEDIEQEAIDYIAAKPWKGFRS